MRVKKTIAMIAAITITFSATAGNYQVIAANGSVVCADNTAPELMNIITPPVVSTADIPSEDIVTTDDGWQYSIQDDELAICGYVGEESEITIPDVIDGYDVLNIWEYAFADNTNLTKVDLGIVKNIGVCAFTGCTNLKEITIPTTVESTGDTWTGGFEGSGIETVIFEDGTEVIPARICKNASNLKNIILPDSVNIIGDNAFAGTSISSVTFPESITEIQSGAFGGCKQLKEITIPKTVEKTGGSWDGCFEQSGIETVIFEDGTETIPAYACKNASSVKSVVLPDSVNIIGEGAFSGTSISSVTIPENVNEIQSGAFSGCEQLKEIMIPDNVTTIGEECFAGCKSMEKFSLGKSVKSLGSLMLKGCELITEVTIPKTVESGYTWPSISGGCLAESMVETVIFEEGIEKIPANICQSASSVKNIILPVKENSSDGYTIEEYAFAGTSISTIKIPESVTSIQNNVFSECKYLEKISIPESVIFIGTECFEKCESLEDVSLGKNVEEYGACVFKECKELTTLVVPPTVTNAEELLSQSCVEILIIEPGMEITPKYLASNCTTLKTVYLPDTVKEIGDHTFSGCTNLEKIDSDRTSFDISPTSFDRCLKLDDPRFIAFDVENTCFLSNSELSEIDDMVSYTLKYKLNPSFASEAKNIKLVIDIPEGMTMMLDSVQCKNFELGNGNFSDGVLVNSPEAELRFTVRINEKGSYNITPVLSFDYDLEGWNQIIGQSEIVSPELTMSVPENTNEFTVDVYGLATKGENVEIYVNDVLSSTLTANEYTGKYKGIITLPEGTDGDKYAIYAKCGEIKSKITETTYFNKKPVVKNVMFSYNESDELDITDVFKQGLSPVVTFDPAYPISFEITATNNEEIDRLFITSTKCGIMKYIEAFYDDKTQTWIADGYFDEDNHSYIPGALNVSIIEKNAVVLDKDYDYKKDYFLADISAEYSKNSSVENIEFNGNSFLANVTVSDGETASAFMTYISNNKESVYIDGKCYDKATIAKDPEKYGFVSRTVQTIEDGKRVTYYRKSAESKDIISSIFLDCSENPDVYNDIWSGEIILKVTENESTDEPVCELINIFVSSESKNILNNYIKNTYGKGYGVLYKNIGIGLSLSSDICKYITHLEMTGGSKEYEDMTSALFAFKFIISQIFKADSEYSSYSPVPAVIVTGIDGLLYSIDEYLAEYIRNNTEFVFTGYIRFIIDPSGYVYEAVPDNRISGAELSIYYKDPETEETVLWNAADYDQMNTIYSDSEGRYAWDVPEGMWQVKCELDGYDTLYSEWLPVPPVQTDVNFNLVSKAAPVLYQAVTDDNDDDIVVKFSKFVDISTVTTESLILDGFNGAYEIEPCLLNESDIYTDTFIISGDFNTPVMSVSAEDSIISYAGVAAKETNVPVTGWVPVPGDVNNDGVTSALDLLRMKQYLLSLIDRDEAPNGDIDKDGRITASDLVKLTHMLIEC